MITFTNTIIIAIITHTIIPIIKITIITMRPEYAHILPQSVGSEH
jgi:hypothetical protein